jgi:tetratricopeptide (TPR) repeat protein
MSSMATLESVARPAVAPDDEAVPKRDGAAAAMGAWMTVLGAIRLIGEVVAYSGAIWGASVTGELVSRGWIWFLEAHPPAHVLINAWPLILGLALRRTGRRDLLIAGALTFLVLSIGGLLAAFADWSEDSSRGIAIGSFRLSKSGWSRPTTAVTAIGVAGASQLLIELATAAWALRMATRRDRDRPPSDGRDVSQPSRSGQIALYFSVAFLLLTIRLPAWTAYMELLNQSRWLRELILRDDLSRLRGPRRPPRPESAWAFQVQDLLREARVDWNRGKYAEASDRFARIRSVLDTIPTSSMNLGERQLAAESLNDWAWLMATCPDEGFRRSEDAIRYARRALELAPNEYAYWNTLGVACYRLGNLDDALSAIYRSMELHEEGDSSDWFFLAMIHQRLGHKERAREWHDMAVQYAHIYKPGDDELYRFEVEAAQMLGLPKPEKMAPPVMRRQGPRLPGSPPSGRRGRMGPRTGVFELETNPGPSPRRIGR